MAHRSCLSVHRGAGAADAARGRAAERQAQGHYAAQSYGPVLCRRPRRRHPCGCSRPEPRLARPSLADDSPQAFTVPPTAPAEPEGSIRCPSPLRFRSLTCPTVRPGQALSWPRLPQPSHSEERSVCSLSRSTNPSPASRSTETVTSALWPSVPPAAPISPTGWSSKATRWIGLDTLMAHMYLPSARRDLLDVAFGPDPLPFLGSGGSRRRPHR